MIKIGKKLKAFRTYLELSQQEFSIKIDSYYSKICRLERGTEKRLTLDNLSYLSNLGISLDWLFGDSKSPLTSDNQDGNDKILYLYSEFLKENKSKKNGKDYEIKKLNMDPTSNNVVAMQTGSKTG